MTSGCIHDHGYLDNAGVVGTDGEAHALKKIQLNLTLNIDWPEILHQIDLGTRASDDNFRIFVELKKDGVKKYQEKWIVKAEDFSSGLLKRTLSTTLAPERYDLTVWCDADLETPLVDPENLDNIEILNTSTTNGENIFCGGAHEILNLNDNEPMASGTPVEKNITINPIGGRFELIATDIREFISQNRPALLQGDSFTLRLHDIAGGFMACNLYEEPYFHSYPVGELSGSLRLPFDDYQELKIADCFLFCKDEDEFSMNLTVVNSALVTVSRSERFSFPMKRGYVTRVRADFLTHPVDGIFSVDNIWEGDIEHEWRRDE